MIRCQACGTENGPDATYCTKCARKLDTATQQEVVERRAAHTVTGIRWTSVIAAVIIILILVMVIALAVVHVI